MGFPIGKALGIAFRALTVIQTAVPAVEAASKAFKAGGGAEKKAAVLELVRAHLAAAELATGRDLLEDGDVMDAAGKLNDAYVALLKVIAQKTGAAVGT